MMKRLAVAVAACLALASCGGTSGNAAAAKTFTYGAPQTASSTQLSAVSSQVASASSVQGAPDASGAQAVATFSAATDALFGNSGVPVATTPQQRQALAAARLAAARQLTASTTSSFDNQATCVTLATNRVDLGGCKLTVTDSSGSTTQVQVGGWLAVDPIAWTAKWALQLDTTTSFANASVSGGEATVHLHESGDVTVTSTTMKGEFLAELTADVSAMGLSTSMGMDESLTLDVTYAPAATCSSRVTSGTLEAKRVWTSRPMGATAAQYPDEGATIDWTGCGTGTIAFNQ